MSLLGAVTNMFQAKALSNVEFHNLKNESNELHNGVHVPAKLATCLTALITMGMALSMGPQSTATQICGAVCALAAAAWYGSQKLGDHMDARTRLENMRQNAAVNAAP